MAMFFSNVWPRQTPASFGTVPSESPIGLSRRSPALAVKLLGSTSHPIM
jgi:hypothetical protein